MSVRLDATADMLTRTTTLPTITSFTMMGWFLISVDTNAYTNFLVFGNATTVALYAVQTTGDGTTFNWFNGSIDTPGSALTVGAWTHLAGVVAGTGANQTRAYINGVQSVQANGNASVTAQKLWVGNNVFSEFLNGRAAAVKIYNAALTADEILTEMRCYLPIRTLDLNSWLPLRDVGEQVIDYSGVGGNWTVGGTLATEDGPPIPWSFRQPGRAFAAPAVVTRYAPPPFQRRSRLVRRMVIR